MISGFRPLQSIEESIRLWPPSLSFADWLYRVFVSPLLRWDTAWYQRILTQGFRPDDGTSSFHPLFPLLAKPWVMLGLDASFSLLLVSMVAGLGLVYFWYRLARLDLNEQDSRVSILLFLFFPLSFILFVPYTEALFLLLSVACVYWTRQHRWLLAGLSGGLAVLTRQHGVFLLVLMLWELWEAAGKNWRRAATYVRGWLGTALIPAAMLAWLFYRAFHLNDVVFNWRQPASFFDSFLISASHAQVVPVFKFLWPWQSLSLAYQKMIAAPDLDIWVNLIFAGIFLGLFVLAWRNLSIGYRLYSLVVVLVAFSYHTGPLHPYMGLVRHVWLAFPIFIGLAPKIRGFWARLGYVGLGLVGLLFLQLQYVLESWVP